MTASAVVVGLMSGTSADGIAAAAVRFTEHADAAITADLLAFETTPYSDDERGRILLATERGNPREYCRLSFDLGEWLARAAISVMRSASLGSGDVAAIASHGHTIWHEPGHSTWQIGEAAVIAERTGVDVIANFRVADVAAGGQGAPLVTIADALLFAAAGQWRALQNLGGIANVTVVPPAGFADPVRAFDTGPGCAVIDAVTQMVLPALRFDDRGALARRGTPIESVVTEELRSGFFLANPPKSTGREQFGGDFAERFTAACRIARRAATSEDVIASAVSLTARSIGDAYSRWVPHEATDVLLSGGGARNDALVDAISRALAPRTVRLFDELFFDGEAKEAVAFALLGFLKLIGKPGNVPDATGARGRRVLGALSRASGA